MQLNPQRSPCAADDRNVAIRAVAQPKADFAGLPSNITTCAVVGNAGHLRQKLYGPHIDNHDVVVRFNLVRKESLLNVTGHKVSLRFINHASATHLCKLSRPWENVRLYLLPLYPYALTAAATHSFGIRLSPLFQRRSGAPPTWER